MGHLDLRRLCFVRVESESCKSFATKADVQLLMLAHCRVMGYCDQFGRECFVVHCIEKIPQLVREYVQKMNHSSNSEVRSDVSIDGKVIEAVNLYRGTPSESAAHVVVQQAVNETWNVWDVPQWRQRVLADNMIVSHAMYPYVVTYLVVEGRTAKYDRSMIDAPKSQGDQLIVLLNCLIQVDSTVRAAALILKPSVYAFVAKCMATLSLRWLRGLRHQLETYALPKGVSGDFEDRRCLGATTLTHSFSSNGRRSARYSALVGSAMLLISSREGKGV